MTRKPVFSRVVVAAGLTLGWQATAWAQTIGYAPDLQTPVPTLSEWGMIALSILMAAVAIQTARKGGSRILSAFLAVGAISAGMGVEQTMVKTAQATPLEQMSIGSGGTVDLSGYPTGMEVPVQGHPTIPMRIISVSPSSDTTVQSPRCTVGLAVPAGGLCYYRVPGLG
ncbi:midcut-by-XrtH protein [Zoogloea sp.]|uniref:midcut-by-XrtH protein n=1 Tax=Zoogloea sp. TaxID=49181 RepID=UPI00141686AE|nr:MAG: midcut-by-XrtH protein [Zoogloea sp.]